jgi:membrane associated rhomboid family serine protease
MIPLAVDRQSPISPWITTAIVVTNLLAFVAVGTSLREGGSVADSAYSWGVFIPSASAVAARPWTLVTYAFLHDPSGLAHVGFNMLFLFIFGRAVEGRLGHVRFALLYVGGCVVAALGQWLISRAPMIGASGAVAAVTGAFAALCPRARVRLLIFFSVIEISGLAAVILFAVIDLVGQMGSFLGSGARVAYIAHLAGYAFGIGTMLLLLGTGLLPRSEFDLFFLLRQWRRRRAMADAFRQSSPWTRSAGTSLGGGVPAANTPRPGATSADPPPRAWNDADVRRALDDANSAFERGDFSRAAAAWERVAARAPHHAEADGALLMAALTAARHLGDRTRAQQIVDALLTRSRPCAAALRQQAAALRAELSPPVSGGGT